MKKIILLLLMFACSAYVQAQQYTHEQLYDSSSFEEDARKMVERLIDGLAKSNPDIPTSKWESIKEDLDYSKVKERIVGVYKKYYTDEEVRNIFLQNDMIEPINDTGYFIFEPKKEAADDLYQQGKYGGRELMQQAIKMIKEGGW